jgi:predicted DNA-binding transcriptional regulator AlpA
MTNYLKQKDLQEMGFGNRVTIWKKVKQKEFPAPMKFGNGINSPNVWHKEDIDEYIQNLRTIARSKGVNYEPRTNQKEK